MHQVFLQLNCTCNCSNAGLVHGSSRCLPRSYGSETTWLNLLSIKPAVSLQVRLNDPSQYQSIVDAEWKIIYDKLDRCVESGAKVVLSRLAIGDLGTQYFADRDIFCAGRVSALVFSVGICAQSEPTALSVLLWLLGT